MMDCLVAPLHFGNTRIDYILYIQKVPYSARSDAEHLSFAPATPIQAIFYYISIQLFLFKHPALSTTLSIQVSHTTPAICDPLSEARAA